MVVCRSRGLACDRNDFEVAQDTSARRVEAHAGRPAVSKSLGTVMNAYLPAFGVEDL
jgi:hypothetical protein